MCTCQAYAFAATGYQYDFAAQFQIHACLLYRFIYHARRQLNPVQPRDLFHPCTDVMLPGHECCRLPADGRSEEHTSELQSLMRISYAVFCLKKKKYMTKINTRY